MSSNEKWYYNPYIVRISCGLFLSAILAIINYTISVSFNWYFYVIATLVIIIIIDTIFISLYRSKLSLHANNEYNRKTGYKNFLKRWKRLRKKKSNLDDRIIILIIDFYIFHGVSEVAISPSNVFIASMIFKIAKEEFIFENAAPESLTINRLIFEHAKEKINEITKKSHKERLNDLYKDSKENDKLLYSPDEFLKFISIIYSAEL